MCRTASRHHRAARTGRQATDPGVADHLRVSDADRERTIARLREHAGAGRLDVDELELRVERAHAARVGADLRVLERDLPAIRLPEDRAAAEARRRAEVREHATQYLAVMVLLVAIWALTGAGAFWPIWPMLGWGIGVAAHAAPVLAGGRAPRLAAGR